MPNESLTNTIKIIHERLSNNKIKWALIGSANMKLQGMEIEPRDLDIVVRLKDLQSVSEIFSDYSASAVRELKFLRGTGKPALEVRAKINGMEIQFVSGGEEAVYASKLLAGKIIFIKLDNLEIPCFTLEAEAQAYMETNRKEKADLIRNFQKSLLSREPKHI